MKAAVLRGVKQSFMVEDISVDDPMPDEVRVRTAASGLCHSDVHAIVGDLPAVFPTVLGHEAAGVVEAVGSQVTRVNPGDHVVVGVSLFCGQCPTCLRGSIQRCLSRPGMRPKDRPRLKKGTEVIDQKTMIAGHSEILLVHQNALAVVPKEMPLDRAAVLGCAVTTGVGAVINTAKVAPGDTVVVIGCGGVGLNAIQGARLAGAGMIIGVDLNPMKLELAKKFGATHTVPGGKEAVDGVKSITKGGADHVLEVIGLIETIQQGYSMLGSGGTLTLIGVPANTARLEIPGTVLSMIATEKRIQGSIMGSSPFPIDVPRFASWYLNGRLELDALISKRIRLDEVNDGYANMLGGKVARSVIVFEDVLKAAAS